MDRAQQIGIAKRILELYDQDGDDQGEISWETDIGRFVDKERFEVEKQEFFLTRHCSHWRFSRKWRLLRHGNRR